MKHKGSGRSWKILFLVLGFFIHQACVWGQSGEVVAESVPSNTNPESADQIDVQINIDMTQVSPPDHNLGSYTGKLTWDQAVLEYLSFSGGHTSGWESPTVNEANVSTGEVKFSGANAFGSTGKVNVISFKLKVIGTAGSTTPLDLEFSAMAAASTFKSLLGILTVTDGNITVGESRFDISGVVSYYSNTNPVPQTILQLTEASGTHEEASGANGDYLFEKITSGDVQLQPSKQNDQADAITGSDALLILQYLAFLISFTPDQRFAADVTEDGNVTGSDAQAILRYLAFYSDNIASTGQWRFDPTDTIFTLISNSLVNFKAFLLGDATGDWTSAELTRSSSLAKPGSSALLRIVTEEKKAENQIVALIILAALQEPVHTLVLSLDYDLEALKYIDAEVTACSQDFMMVTNGSDSGKVHVAMAGVNAIRTFGAIVRLVFARTAPLQPDEQMEIKFSRALVNDLPCASENGRMIANLSVETGLPSDFHLAQNYPNPFFLKDHFSNTTISFQLPRSAEAVLTIYNVAGRLINRIKVGWLQPGRHQIVWDGTSDAGDRVAAGLYFYQLTAGSFTAMKKMLVIR